MATVVLLLVSELLAPSVVCVIRLTLWPAVAGVNRFDRNDHRPENLPGFRVFGPVTRPTTAYRRSWTTSVEAAPDDNGRFTVFIQVIQGRCNDADALHRQMDRWREELEPGATGWLGGHVWHHGRRRVRRRRPLRLAEPRPRPTR